MLLLLLYKCAYMCICVCAHTGHPHVTQSYMEEQDWVWAEAGEGTRDFAVLLYMPLSVWICIKGIPLPMKEGLMGRVEIWLLTLPGAGGGADFMVHLSTLASAPLEINYPDPCAKNHAPLHFLWLRILHIFLYVNSCCFFFCEVCVIGPFISWGLWLHGKAHQREKALMWGSPKPPASTTMWGLHGDQGAGGIAPLLDLPLMMSSVPCTL